MLTNRNIAFFIDLYNTELNAEHYNNIVEQLGQMGSILSGTIYGATERTHKEVLAQADERGYRVVRTPRRRGKKTFDLRIIVDVVDKVSKSIGIDTVCIVSQPAELVYLFAYLRERGIKIVTLSNGDEASMALVDDVVDAGKVETLKLPKAHKAPVVAPETPSVPVEAVNDEPAPVEVITEPAQEPAPVETPSEPVEAPSDEPTPVEAVTEPVETPTETPSQINSQVSRMDELLREIDRLRSEVEQSASASAMPVPQAPSDEVAPVETPSEPTDVEGQDPAPAEVVTETPSEPAEAPSDEPAPVDVAPEETPTETPTEQPRASYTPTDDGDLLRKIEQMRQDAADDDAFIEEIKKLLDDID